MKVTSKGRLKLERRDVRLGNFVVTDEGSHIKFQDIGGLVSHRISTMTPKGMLMKSLFDSVRKGGDSNAEATLTAYVVCMANVLSVLPVSKGMSEPGAFVYLNELNALAVKQVELTKEVYGVVDEPEKEEDDKVLEEEVDAEEAIELAKKELGI